MFSDLPRLVRVALLLLSEERAAPTDTRADIRETRLNVLCLMTIADERTFYAVRETLDALQLFAYRGTR